MCETQKIVQGIMLVPIFTKIMLAWQPFVLSSYAKFHETVANSSVSDTRSQIEMGVASTWSLLLITL
jgi:hypothetical protein